MSPLEADSFVDRMKGTWRLTATDRIWREEIIGLEHAPALATYLKLRREAKAAPSIAMFMDMYATQLEAPAPSPACSSCDSTGWVCIAPPEYHAPGCSQPKAIRKPITGQPGSQDIYPCRCSAAKPCLDCSRGKAMQQTHRAILAFNARHTRLPAHDRPEQGSMGLDPRHEPF